MAVSLREHQHEVRGPDEADGFVFGTEDTGYLTLSRPVVVAGDVRENDTPRPQEDGRAMGRDYRGGKSYTFEIGVLTDLANGYDDPHRDNLDALNALEALWTDEQWRDNPQAYAILRSCEAGRIRRCYGRPRAYAEVAGKMTAMGYTPAVAQFALMEDVWYDDYLRQQSFTVSIPTTLTLGLSAPLVAPLNGGDSTVITTGSITNAGSRPTWLTVEFVGPAVNPEVQVGDVLVSLVGTLAVGQSLVYDPRPWIRSIVNNDGRSTAGDMTANTTMMKYARLRPGPHAVRFEAGDATGQARVNLSWRDAYGRP